MEWKEIFGLVADAIGIFGAFFALRAWLLTRSLRQGALKEEERQNRKVRVILQHGAGSIELPVELRRFEATRAEILGILGMIPMVQKGQRFSLSYLGRAEFLHQINQIASGTGDGLLTIPCTAEEFAQFDMDVFKMSWNGR